MKLTKWYAVVLFAIFSITTFCHGSLVAGEKNTKTKTDKTNAGIHRIVNTYSFPGFSVIQFQLSVLSVYSYLLISKREALMIDPVRDISFYLETARKKRVKIKGVYLSHSHADFIAGHMEMVKAVRCPIYQSHKSGAKYRFRPVSEKTEIKIGKARIRFLETPGHTLDGMCAAVYSVGNPKVPKLLFTGDVLFAGSVGRPDLMGGTVSAAELAAKMFDSWNQKLSVLDNKVKIFPAHGAGSLCGLALTNEPFSTIGKERLYNPYLQYLKRSEFITALLDGLEKAPQYFTHNATMNREGPPLIRWNKAFQKIEPSNELTNVSKYIVVDVRKGPEYNKSHIPNSINIGLIGKFENWVGTMIPWGHNLVLAGNADELDKAALRLHRVGYKSKVINLKKWEKKGFPLITSYPIKPKLLYNLILEGEAPVIVDVRLPKEWLGVRIAKSVLNFPLNNLTEFSALLDPREPLVLVCHSSYRSNIAIGILERNGFKKVISVEGGGKAWANAGLPVFEANEAKPFSKALSPRKKLDIVETISAQTLNRLMADLPGTFEIVDIRPSEYFFDFNLPGSLNADPADVISDPAYLSGTSPLILVDRDGTLAMAVGGILSQKTKRPIKVLYGGLEAYWSLTKTLLYRDLKPNIKKNPKKPKLDIKKKPSKNSAGC